MTKVQNLKSKKHKKKDIVVPRVVAVGASAGGLEALKIFFANLPDDDQNSYVVIQHLSPDFKSMMRDILAKTAKLPIEQIEDNSEIVPGRIYLIPPVNNLVIKQGKLHLVEKPQHQKLNLPIDIFFESIAETYKEKAIAVVLSGTGSDGTRGIRALKEAGGMVMVQDPEEAQFDGMPRNAILTGLVDYILKVGEMGGELNNFIKATTAFKVPDNEIEYDDKALAKILHYIEEQSDLDFKEYKYSTLARRVARRLNVCKCGSLEEYFNFLKSNPEEIPVLNREFLIGVTKFFRDELVWKILEKDVIPELVSNTPPGGSLKIWDVACSTGEEAYSLAMYIFEEMLRQDKKVEVKIFATDISQQHLDIGSSGMYAESIIADVPPDLIAKYFVKKPQGYQIVDRIRQMVIFSKHNIIKNPPFSNMDMVLCRNLLIYFQTSIQKKALNVLHYGLKEGGFLVMGTSETLGSLEESFKAVSRKWKIYKNVVPKKNLNGENLHASLKRVNTSQKSVSKPRNTTSSTKNNQQRYLADLNTAVLEQFNAASVYIDSDYYILQAIGEFRKYASLPVLGFSTNLLDMLGKDLKHIVQSVVKKAISTNGMVFYRDAVFKHMGENKAMDVMVKPFNSENLNEEKNFVITFIEKELQFDEFTEVEKITTDSETKEFISELEKDLKDTKEELVSSLEEIESSNEELQAANEELLASNEELQSTNEELQSVNEEINTINAENIQKMDDLAALNADMNNLLESTDIGTIFLDSRLRIRKFTPAIKKHFSLITSDIGRPIENFTTSFGVNRGRGLVDRCKRALRTGETMEKNIVSKEGRNYLQRISVFKNSQDEREGVVISFIDIESLQLAKEKLVASEHRFKSFYEDDPIMHFSVDPLTSLIIECNQEAVEKLEYESKEDIIGKPIFDLYGSAAQLKAMELNQVFRETGELKNFQQEMLTKSGKKIPIILNSTVELGKDDKVISNRFTCVDVSELKKAQEELKEQKADLERANRDLEQFVSICSHDLQEPLATIKFGSDVLGKIYADKLDQKGKDYIAYIDEASDRLANQIKALLEHSQIGRDTKKKLVDTKELAEVVKYDLGKRIKDTNAQVNIGVLPKIMGYEVELRLLFQNLLSNALKYKAKDRSPEIRISAYPDGKYWVFSIMDNGIGIGKEDLKNIFTIFNRVPTEEKYEGTGVGLAHVEKIVLLHEGSIWVDSQPGVGSTFYFKIKS